VSGENRPPVLAVELTWSGSGGPPGAGGMQTASPSIWLRIVRQGAAGPWRCVTEARSLHQAAEVLEDAASLLAPDGGAS